MSEASAHPVLESAPLRLLLRLFFVVAALVCGWLIMGASTPASASENTPDPSLLGSVGSAVSSTVQAAEAPVAQVIASVSVAAPAPAAVPVASAVPAIVSTAGDVADASVPLVGAAPAGTVTAPVIDGLDSVIATVPVIGTALGSAPLATVADPVVAVVDQVLASVAVVATPIVDDITDTIADDVIDPIAVVAPIVRPSFDNVGTVASGPTMQAATEGLAASRADAADRRSLTVSRHYPAADSAAVPVTPSAPPTPIAPSTPAPVSSGSAGSAALQPTAATVEHGFPLGLAAARSAFADDDTTPSSLSNDPGSSPD